MQMESFYLRKLHRGPVLCFFLYHPWQLAVTSQQATIMSKYPAEKSFDIYSN